MDMSTNTPASKPQGTSWKRRQRDYKSHNMREVLRDCVSYKQQSCTFHQHDSPNMTQSSCLRTNKQKEAKERLKGSIKTCKRKLLLLTLMDWYKVDSVLIFKTPENIRDIVVTVASFLRRKLL